MTNTISSVPQKDRKEWRNLLTGNINVPLKNFFLQMKVTQAKNQVATGKISLEEAVEDIHNLCVKFFKAKNMDTDLAAIFSSNGNTTTFTATYANENVRKETIVESRNPENISSEEAKQNSVTATQKKETIERLKIKEEKQKLEAERKKLAEERRKLEMEKIKFEAQKEIQAKLLAEKLRKKREQEDLLVQESNNIKKDNETTGYAEAFLSENISDEEDLLLNKQENEQFDRPKRSFFSRIFGVFRK